MKSWKAIAAMSENRVIGIDNQIPWHIPEDFKWFKKTTMDQIIVMGRKTFESIGKALPGRETIVVSRNGFKHPDVKSISNLTELDALTDENKEIFICGGSEIYRQTLKKCSDLYLTIVLKDVDGDAFFPEFEANFDQGTVIREEEDFKILHYKNKNG